MADLTEIPGASISALKQIVDTRGAVLHMVRESSPEFSTFGEVYFSEILPGALKGWKLHHRIIQHLCVPLGEVKFRLVDNREPYRPIKVDVLLGRPDNYHLLTIPAGVWYAFYSLRRSAALVANYINEPYDDSEAETKPLLSESELDQWMDLP